MYSREGFLFLRAAGRNLHAMWLIKYYISHDSHFPEQMSSCRKLPGYQLEAISQRVCDREKSRLFEV